MHVLLVDENDKPISKEDKLKAHKEGYLHRAFSVFIFNSKKELLLQKRSDSKYHSPGLWSNTCCSHPITEDIKKEAALRLKEEMGFCCPLEEKFCFVYKARLEKGLIENEFDHVFFGKYDKTPIPDQREVSDWKWISIPELKKDIEENPEMYTPWLRIILGEVISEINKSF